MRINLAAAGGGSCGTGVEHFVRNVVGVMSLSKANDVVVAIRR